MNIEEIRHIAKTLHIKRAHRSKTELIRSIQTKEGNFDCFGTAASGMCDQYDCKWRNDCFASSFHGVSS